MPNKTIYVSDNDLPLYERAQELAGGSLSAAIVQALRRYVEAGEAQDEGFEEIVVRVGPGKGRKQRFLGQLLGELGRYDPKTMKSDHFHVYRSYKGRYVLHVQHGEGYVSKTEGWRSHLGLAPGSWGTTPGHSTLEIFDTFEELKPIIPEELYAAVKDIEEAPTVEDLDI